jgi:hypothetical protein
MENENVEVNEGTEEVVEVKEATGLPSGTMVICDDGVERPVITREEAIEDGVNRYFTGIECRNGHMAERKVKGYVCTTCARIRQKERKKVRITEDPEFKAKVAAKRTEKHKARYANDPEYRQKVLDRAKARRAKISAEKASMKKQAEAQVVDEA